MAPSAPLHVVMVEFPPAGGLFQFSVQLAHGLARAGCEVTVLTGPRPELSSRHPRVRIRSALPTWHPTAGDDAPEWWRRARRGLRAGQHVAAWLRVIGYAARHRPDVLMWSAWRFPVDGWGVQLVRRVAPTTTLALVAHEPRPLVEQPGQDGLYKQSRLTDSALAGAYRCLDVVFVLGESARRVLLDSWPVTAPVVVIPHGDEDIFRTDEVPSAETTTANALFFGTVTAYKGLDDLLTAWPQVCAEVPDATLDIAGSIGADTDQAALAARVAALPGVTLHAGYVPVDAVAGHFTRARVVVQPYRRSSQSGVSHVAYTFARPVVATRVGDIPSVVRDGQTGLLVEPGDPAGLARAVVALLRDPDRAASFGAAGRASLQSGASWDTVAGDVLRAVTGSGP